MGVVLVSAPAPYFRVLNRIGAMHCGAGCEPAADWQSAC